MQTQSDSKAYDLFKLLILIVLGISLALVWFAWPVAPAETIQPESAETIPAPVPTDPPPVASPDPTAVPTEIAAPELPAFPGADQELTYAETDGHLVTPDGTPVYRLDPAAGRWEPLVPAGLSETSSLQANAGIWQVVDSAGILLYTWNASTLTWEAAETPATAVPDLPPFPEADAELTYRAAENGLFTPDERQVYQFNPGLNTWVPTIPIEIGELLSPDYQPVLDPSGKWTIASATQEVLYTWAPQQLAWQAVEQSEFIPPDDASCPLAMSSQLAVGMRAEVITLLNVRSTPVVGDNLLFVVLDTTLVEIIGGPVCGPYLDAAHWWWQIQLPEGETGWAAEGAYSGEFYYLEPR